MPPKPTAAKVKTELKQHVDLEKATFYQTFFKTGKGEYAQGDKFLGVVVPAQRKVAIKFRELERPQLKKLLHDPYHECRLTALFILTEQFQRAPENNRKTFVKFYLDNTAAVNNWDLVDSSAYKILGEYLVEQDDRDILDQLVQSKNMWEQRIAIVSTYALIRDAQFAETMSLSEQLLDHPHDLIHKAVGWMLRELGKRDSNLLEQFLKSHCQTMPRTMLRYAIEKFPEKKRKLYLAGNVG